MAGVILSARARAGALVVAAVLAAGLFPSPTAAATTTERIVFTSDRDGNDEIYSMNPDGSDVRRLTTNPATEQRPVISSDGTKIAFQTDRDGQFEIYVMNADGSGQMRVTNNVERDEAPSFSPDGTKIAFQRGPSGAQDIYSINVNGTGETPLAVAAGDDATARWSPDGTKIAFASTRDGPDYDIFIMNADGTAHTQLTTNNNQDRVPTFSPDGSKILFSTDRDGVGDELYTMDPDGSNPTRITTLAGAELRPRYSPDGTMIVYDKNVSGSSDIFTIDANGTNETNITNRVGRDEMAFWGSLAMPTPDAKIAKQSTGPWTGNNVYSSDGTGQALLRSIPAGTAKSFYFRVQNDASFADRFVLSAPAGDATYTLTYFRGTTNVTAAVTAGTYLTGSIAPGAHSAVFRVRIFVAPGTTAGSSAGWTIAFTSDTSPEVDAVRADVTVT